MRDRVYISHVYSLWQDLSDITIIFDFVTLTYFWKSFSIGCYLVMVAIQQALLSSDNSYY